jgi:hypothetical protein
VPWSRPNCASARGNPQTLFSSAVGPVPFQSNISGSWFEINGGLDARINQATAIFASVGYEVSTDRSATAYTGKIAFVSMVSKGSRDKLELSDRSNEDANGLTRSFPARRQSKTFAAGLGQSRAPTGQLHLCIRLYATILWGYKSAIPKGRDQIWHCGHQ